ncbi:hypothetical protein DL96DRAFT_1578847 [Flagelloscypha sp. PMI_526]|nr:hypothetical protein DL96DRAFT_1578847 [Flagelloscypha sp. PMI_526]
MSVSKETAVRAAQGLDPMVSPAFIGVPDQEMKDPHTVDVQKPSDVVAPHRTDSIPQQGSTQPGDGHKDHTAQMNNAEPVVEVHKVPFKEQVIGFAKKTRGTVLNHPETKEAGNKILEGQVTHDQL